MAVVRYGVIGCGSIARHRHIPECVANPKSQLAALADPVPRRAEELAADYPNCQAFTDYKQMIKKADLDAVVVCSPNHLHAPMSIEALKAGLHVLVEKPMATTRPEAKKMIEASKKARRYLMVGQNQRLMPAHVKAKQILKSGDLGKPLSFRTAFKHPGPEGWSIDRNKSWFFDKKAAFMGATGDLGVHKADLMRWLLDDEFSEVGGIITTLDKRGPDKKLIPLDDNAILHLKSKKGVVGSIEVSWTNYGIEDNSTIVYCQKGVMSLGTDPDWGVVVDYHDGRKEMHRVGKMASNVEQVASGIIDSFTDSILKKKAPAIDGNEGYASLAIILTAMEAAKAGKVLTIK